MGNPVSFVRHHQRWMSVTLAIVILIGGTAFFLRQSQIVIHRVSGPSMAPTLWGPSQFMYCDHCGWGMRVNVNATESARFPCFRCGMNQKIQLSDVTPGELVSIDHAAYLFVDPRRNDLVAIQTGDHGLQVKRVVGLPGDIVKINTFGQVYVNDTRWISPSILKTLGSNKPGIVVYHHRSDLGASSRLEQLDNIILYRHRNIYNRNLPDSILDDDPSNLGVRRQLQPIRTLYLALEVRSDGEGWVDVYYFNESRRHAVTIDISREVELLLLEIEGSTWKSWNRQTDFSADTDLETMQRLALSKECPLAIHFRELDDFELSHFWIGRDLRFDAPVQLRELWNQGVQVDPGRLIVLGDNATNSRDSRNSPEGVPLQSVLGRVRPVKQ